MVYESSYESGRKPYLPDVNRGYWSSPNDFVYACLGLAFKMDIFSLQWLYSPEGGIFTVVPYLLVLIPIVIPLLIIHMFMGQFSSSGFISAFRLSPFFKGMGYVSMALNFSILIYYSIFAAIPLFFLIQSFRPTLPWSCETPQYWATYLNESEQRTICNTTIESSSQIDYSNDTDLYQYTIFHLPSSLYFKSLYNGALKLDYSEDEYSISFEMVLCNLLIWGIVAGILYKFFHPQRLGKVIRYLVWIILGLMLICLTRFIFLPGAGEALELFFLPNHHSWGYAIPDIAVFSVIAFGPGWGTIVSLSSFNKFNTNIMRHSWYIAIGQLLIIMGFALTSSLLEAHFSVYIPLNDDGEKIVSHVDTFLLLLLSTGSALATMEWANLWCILYYSMLVFASLYILIIQSYSWLTSVFDEFEVLRSRKSEITLGLIGTLALSSIYFCSSYGIIYFPSMSIDSIFSQTALNLLLLLVVLWVYGRVRFQRDIEFMLGQPFATWKVNSLRFFSPIFLLLTLLIMTIIAFYEHSQGSMVLTIIAIIFILAPWLFVPGYGIFCMLVTTGSIKARFKRCCRPTDWYPVETEDRQRYEESVGNADTTHQLHDIMDQVL